MHESLPSLNEANLEGRLLDTLNEALSELPDVDVKPVLVHGCTLIDQEEIETSFIPEDKKVTVTYAGDPDNAPVLYYVKTDAHGSEPFQMPAGKLVPNEVYNVSGFGLSDNGLMIKVANQDSRNYFYTTSLEDVRLEVVDKNDAEKAEQLTQGLDLKLHDHAALTIDRLSSQLDELVNRVAQLPEFDIDSPYRYSVDLFGGGTLYTLNADGTLTKLDEFGGPGGNSRHGDFKGNRLQIIDNKIILIDDAANVGLGSYYSEERGKHFGFLRFKVVDTSAENE